MTTRTGRMTKRNRAKYRRRAYAAGMLANDGREDRLMRWAVVMPVPARRDDDPHGADGRRAA